MAKAVKVVGEESSAPRFSLRSVMGEELNAVEKQSKLTNAGFGRKCKRLSTGVAALDMMLDGGLIPGGWYTIAGPEQAGKSTLTMTLVAACIKQAFSGLGAIFDYEGSSDEDYILSMFRNFGLTKVGIEDVFGIQDPETGKYIKEGFFRYYAPTLGESFFSYMSMMRRRLPDKYVTDTGESYFVFPNTKKNMTLLKGKYDTEWFRKYNTFRVECNDTSMQLLVVVDSYPAMLPEQQDDDDPSAAMALQARMFSDGIKRFRGSMRSKMMTIFGVNQLREKPAVQHGDPSYEPCFVGSTTVHLADGSTLPIKTIVDQKLAALVPSLDVGTGEVSNQPIVDWKDNGYSDDIVEVRYTKDDVGGAFRATRNHKIRTSSGWQCAGDLEAGTQLVSDCGNTFVQEVVSVHGERVYDLTVATNHTYYVADGIAVSNCGNALKFFCVDPTTLVETKAGWCTAQQYMDMHGDQDVLPAIRCPHTDGYVVPSKVFQSDGGEYKERGALSITTGQGLTLSGSAGHSILTCCPREFQMFDGATTVPDIRWTRMCNIEKIPQPWVFIDPVMLDHPVDVRALWETFLGANAPLVLKHCAIVNDIPDVGPHIEQYAVNALAAGDMELQEYEDFMCQHAFIEELVHVYLQLGVNNVLAPDVCVGVLKAEPPTHYIDFCTEGSWISGGIVSHNSDVRIRTMGRAIPDGFAGERGVVEEPSVEFEGRVDRYKFVSGRTHKNKLGGIPNQEFWFRIWEADGKGRARGIDPVYDTWWYLKKVGLLAGTRNKLKFLAPCPLAGAKRAINWQELKSLVSGNKQQITDVCTDMGVKPVNVRNWVFSFTRSEAGRQLARDSIVSKIKAAEDEE